MEVIVTMGLVMGFLLAIVALSARWGTRAGSWLVRVWMRFRGPVSTPTPPQVHARNYVPGEE